MSDMQKFLKDNPEWAKCPDLLIRPPTRDEIQGWYPETDYSLLDHIDEWMGGYTRGALYCQMRQNGSAHRFAEMVALQRGPVLSTDSTFFEGQKSLDDQFGDRILDTHVKAAKRRGFNIPKGATYFSELARFPQDPEAYVDRSMGRGYIKKLCEKRGWACEGAVKADHRQPESDPLAPENCKPLADDIIRDRAIKMAQKDPSVMQMDRRELREKIIDKHGPSK